MLMSIPYNKYDDGTVRLSNLLFCMNNKFEKCLSVADLMALSQEFSEIYYNLMEIQFSLNSERYKMNSEEVKKYQTSLDNAFKYVRLIDKKIANARKAFISTARDANLTSFKDSICFSKDDLIQ